MATACSKTYPTVLISSVKIDPLKKTKFKINAYNWLPSDFVSTFWYNYFLHLFSPAKAPSFSNESVISWETKWSEDLLELR